MSKKNKTKKRSSKNNSVTKVMVGGYRVSIHAHPKKKLIGLNVVAPMDEAADDNLMRAVVDRCVRYLVDEGFLPSRREAAEQGIAVRVNAWGKK